ncbi:hypothetical protein N7509_010991 [Penicillium cosmopolitanum]|uniref:DUF4045 domain-containing protein n=1 Tax=Penicillium cosmopolitanum TaxID=1131564 RepID=A0A9W9VSN8_9EURO|nr:uncharacterized protein N7509_010991 [Penicillium cosmopolitanum]KAJ5388450.1 hypothetical protein N7509_010991 [Penicillium cosmopolitanum]
MTTNPDGSEDVNDFLSRIRELGEKRDTEDEERTKKLEEEILQGRKERQARRAGTIFPDFLQFSLADADLVDIDGALAQRARSIAGSPTLNPSRLSASSLGQPSIEPPEHLEPTVQTQDPDTATADTARVGHERNASESSSRRGSVQEVGLESPTRTMPTLSRSRTGTLSWQQRPSSRDLGNRSPGSTSPTRSSHLRNTSTASDQDRLSRAQFPQSLSSKDPSWFRQSPDRGADSPALRKTEHDSEGVADPAESRQLPGLSRDSTVEPDRAEDATPSPPRTASTIGESSFHNRFSSVSSVSPATGLGSPVTLPEAPKLDPTQTEASTDEPVPASPTQRRMSPERSRSSSPTKGLGGFVQSAMMRRSDSVSKRWSTQLPQGLSRSNSIVSNRNSVAAPSLTASISDMTPTTNSRVSRESSPVLNQRPGSSHSEVTVVHPKESTERPTTPSNPGPNDSGRLDASPSRPALYGHARSTSSMTIDSQNTEGPSSPFTSRTMDPKRWSPQKASWLESALNRPPESPKHQRQPSQPAWQRERQSRGSVDLSRFKEVTPIGLMRTPLPGGHFKKPSLSGAPSALGSPTAPRSKEAIPTSPTVDADEKLSPTKPEPVAEERMASSELTPEPEKEEPVIGPTAVLEPQSQPEPEPEPESQPETEPSFVPEPALEPAPEAVPEVAPESAAESAPAPEHTLEPQPTRKAAPLTLNPKPNFSLPSRDPMSPRIAKPPQSPVVDFRANLRKREVAKDTGPQKEPEFKNVFGKLKKTETRNYVAPDELKGNIMRGKAALNVTGGPKRTERVDEFKDSLVKQKEAMKAGGGSIRRNTVGKDDEPEKPATDVPEAIAKRHLMNRTNSIRPTSPEKSFAAPRGPPPVSPSSTAGEVDAVQIPSPIKREPMTIDREPHAISTPVAQDSTTEESSSAVEVDDVPSADATSPARGLPPLKNTETAPAVSLSPSSAPRGKLAGRINPALAALLSRGPPVVTEEPRKGSVSVSNSSETSTPPFTPLAHMTKSRAKGPKRRLPKGTAALPESSAQDTKEVGAISSPEVTSPETAPEPRAPLDKPLPAVASSFQNALNSGLQQRLKNTPPSPVSTGGPDIFAPSEKENATLTRDMESPGAVSPLSRPPVPPKHITSPSPSPSPSTPAPRPQWAQQARYASTSPSPLRTSYGENRMEKPQPPTPTYKNIPGVTVADSSPRSSGQYSPPVPRKRSDISLDKPSDPHRLSRKMSAPSLVAQAADAHEIIKQFFKTFPNPRDRMDIDPQLMLMEKADSSVVRTMKRQIWELTGDGKRQELPVNQEYVLYEGSMYLCVHLFEAQNNKNSEVYLWCGDDVPEGAQDDAQLFARKIARENGCKLEVIRQGREPMRFIQALGGIIITRRGSHSRSNSSALYMLCGRKHLGQMAFDEVDYSLRNLCSGFPFVISAPFGKLYLWKGKGSSPEETGAARLISMDLGLTGEFEEVDEGQEPESFFDDFAGSNEPNPLMTSEYWQLKPKYDHFRTRLLKVDHEMGQPPRFWMRRPGSSSPVVRPNDTVREIEPFCYKDIIERDVFVLDTFFEIYVIVGDHASQKSADFASAVVFAHEYGILAASLQDRPFIPKSFISLGGVPDRCQSAFRKWNQHSLHAPCVFPLDVAIEAIRSPDRA